MSRTMMKTVLSAAVAGSLLAACVAPSPDGQPRQRPNHDDSTGSLLHRPGDTPPTNGQVDPNQILNPGATQPHVKS